MNKEKENNTMNQEQNQVNAGSGSADTNTKPPVDPKPEKKPFIVVRALRAIGKKIVDFPDNHPFIAGVLGATFTGVAMGTGMVVAAEVTSSAIDDKKRKSKVIDVPIPQQIEEVKCLPLEQPASALVEEPEVKVETLETNF